jgi:CrcB protein
VTALWVVLGASIGAPSRYFLDLTIQSRRPSPMPWGTMTVNVVGSLILGLVASVVAHTSSPAWLIALVGTGFCGAFTTFSTFSFETVRLIEVGRATTAVAYVTASLLFGLAAVALGWWVGSAVSR